MTQMLPITQSSFDNYMNSALPFPNYTNAWLQFRQITNEKLITAQHLSDRTSILNNNSIVDIGAGDGSFIHELLLKHGSKIKNACLIEIDKENCSKSRELMEKGGYKFNSLQICNQDLLKVDSSFILSFEAILASHIFYLLPLQFLHNLISSFAPRHKLYIILDEPYSIFGSLWVKSAPIYHQKLIQTHKLLESLNPAKFFVSKSLITTKMLNPLLLPQDQKVEVISLLCYSNAENYLRDENSFVSKTLKKFEKSNCLDYNSLCYEISLRR